MSIFVTTVLGEPIPQGSLRAVARGRLISDNDRLRPWRDSVAWTVQDTMQGCPPYEGPLAVTATFVLPRPKSAPKGRWAPEKKPDLDKLLRALFDGITAGGGWVDDAQVVRISAGKAYATETLSPRVVFSVQHAVDDTQPREAFAPLDRGGAA